MDRLASGRPSCATTRRACPWRDSSHLTGWCGSRSMPGRAGGRARSRARPRPRSSSRARSPALKKAVDPPGLMYVRSCGGWRIDLTKAEPERAWRDDVLGWMARARSGPGRFGRYRTATAYLPGRGSWGGLMVGSCAPPPCQVAPDGPGRTATASRRAARPRLRPVRHRRRARPPRRRAGVGRSDKAGDAVPDHHVA